MNTKGVEIGQEFIDKLLEVDSFENLKALVKETGIDITDEELAQYFDVENQVLKLTEEELEQIAAGCNNGIPVHDWQSKR